MDGKKVAIGVLVVMAVLLGGIVASSLREERAAYAQGGVYATYLAAAVLVRSDMANFAVIDTEARRLVFYDIDQARYELKPSAGRVLDRDFQRRSSTP